MQAIYFSILMWSEHRTNRRTDYFLTRFRLTKNDVDSTATPSIIRSLNELAPKSQTPYLFESLVCTNDIRPVPWLYIKPHLHPGSLMTITYLILK